MRFKFELKIDRSASSMSYVCNECGIQEHGGSIPNPGLYLRMRQHLTELHSVSRDDKYERLHTEITAEMHEVIFTLIRSAEHLNSDTEREAVRSDALPIESGDWMPDRRVYLSFMVDTNCVNARQSMPAMNQLEQWAANGLIELMTTQVAQDEMCAGGNEERKEKAYSYIFSISAISSSQEEDTLQQIQSLLFPAGASEQNQRNDVEIVFNAAKYRRPLVTNDGGSKAQPGGILGNRQALQELGVTVLTPEEAVESVRKAIIRRDKNALLFAEHLGVDLPEWVGTDLPS